MLESFSFYLSFCVILFIFIVALLIFAPKSHNFYKLNDIYPQLYNICSNENVIDNTLIKLNIELNEDELSSKYKKYKAFFDEKKELPWMDWPDKKIVDGDVQILPLYLYSKIYIDTANIFKELYDQIKLIENVVSVFFIKLPVGSKILPHNGWKELSNDNLRFIFCFNSFCYDDTQCGIWINGETKKLYQNDFYLYDSSIEHSIYNNTYDDIIFLCIDIERPAEISRGVSTYSMKKINGS